jgi:adenosylmethionine-8-amino-7-oxononanoate aminotransferase
MKESDFDKLLHQANEHLWPLYTQRNTSSAMAGSDIIVEASRSYYVDDQGKRYLDVTGGFHCCLVGHRRQEVTDAVYQQMNKVDFGGEFTTVPTAGAGNGESRDAAAALTLPPLLPTDDKVSAEIQPV